MSDNHELDLTHVDRIVSELGTRSDAVVAVLQAIQQQYRFLPQRALERVCELTQITPASIAGVSTFYTHFRHRPVGQRMVHVCRGTACHVKGAELVQGAIEHHLGLTDGEDTDAEGRFTVQPVACLGCCTLAPVVQIDGSTYGRVSARNAPRILEASLRDSEADRAARRLPPRVAGGPKGEIRIGLGSCCQAQGSGRVHDTILSVLDRSGAAAEVKRVGCIGMCHQTPLMQLVAPDGGSTFSCARSASRRTPHRAAPLSPARRCQEIELPRVAVVERVLYRRGGGPGGDAVVGHPGRYGLRLLGPAEARRHGVLRRHRSGGSRTNTCVTRGSWR